MRRIERTGLAAAMKEAVEGLDEKMGYVKKLTDIGVVAALSAYTNLFSIVYLPFFVQKGCLKHKLNRRFSTRENPSKMIGSAGTTNIHPKRVF